MGSTHRGTIYHMVKTNKVGSKVAVSAQKGAETMNTSPHRGQGYVPASSPRSGAASINTSPPRRSEAGHPTIFYSTPDHPRSSSTQTGPGLSGAPSSRMETRSKSEAYRHISLPQKMQQAQGSAPFDVQVPRNVSPSREESTRRGGESKPGRDASNRYSVLSDAKSSRRLSFVDQKDNLTILEDDPPSKVQCPQGVRGRRRSLVYPKDAAVQTEPIQKSSTAAGTRSPKRPPSPEYSSSRSHTDYRTTQRRVPCQESEMSRQNSIYTEPKALHRNRNLESSLTLSVLKDFDGGFRVSTRPEPESIHRHSAYPKTKPSPKVLMSSKLEANVKSSIRGDTEAGRKVTISSGRQTVQLPSHVTSRAVSESPHRSSVSATPEPTYKLHTKKPSGNVFRSPRSASTYSEPSGKPSVHAELELTPRPLPPRSLPRYGPDCSWWALLNPEIEMPQSWSTTPDFEPKSPSPLDPSLPFFEMDSSPFCEDLMFPRGRANPSPPPAPAASPSPPPPPLPKESPSRAPSRDVPQAPKHASKQPIQRFSAFFLGM